MPLHREQDFYAWAAGQAQAIRAEEWTALDLEGIANCLEDMGKSERRALISQLSRLIKHLLKWEYQPTRRSPSWSASIVEAQGEIELLLEDSPSLKAHISQHIQRAYDRARRAAAKETGRPLDVFPKVCPYQLEYLMQVDL